MINEWYLSREECRLIMPKALDQNTLIRMLQKSSGLEDCFFPVCLVPSSPHSALEIWLSLQKKGYTREFYCVNRPVLFSLGTYVRENKLVPLGDPSNLIRLPIGTLFKNKPNTTMSYAATFSPVEFYCMTAEGYYPVRRKEYEKELILQGGVFVDLPQISCGLEDG